MAVKYYYDNVYLRMYTVMLGELRYLKWVGNNVVLKS